MVSLRAISGMGTLLSRKAVVKVSGRPGVHPAPPYRLEDLARAAGMSVSGVRNRLRP